MQFARAICALRTIAAVCRISEIEGNSKSYRNAGMIERENKIPQKFNKSHKHSNSRMCIFNIIYNDERECA